MAEFTRGEFDARLEATEERMNARLAGIEATLGILVNKVDGLGVQVTEARNEAARAREAALGSKWSVIATVIGTGIAGVALVYAILAYGLQNFEAAIATIQALGGSQ